MCCEIKIRQFCIVLCFGIALLSNFSPHVHEQKEERERGFAKKYGTWKKRRIAKT